MTKYIFHDTFNNTVPSDTTYSIIDDLWLLHIAKLAFKYDTSIETLLHQ